MRRIFSRSVTPMLELVIVLFFFAFMSTMVLRLFVLAYQRSVLARDISQALAVAQDVAEEFRGGASPDALGLEAEGGRFFAFYDAAWYEVDRTEALYQLVFVPDGSVSSSGGTLSGGLISVLRVESATEFVLAELRLLRHMPGLLGGGS